MTARSAAEIRADLADCDRDGLPWPSAARRLLADIEPLLGQLADAQAQLDAARRWQAKRVVAISQDPTCVKWMLEAEAAEARIEAVRAKAEEWRAFQPGAFYPEASAYANAIESCGDALIDLLDEPVAALSVAPQPEPDGPWAVDLVCCDRDDGVQVCATWSEADAFRQSYIEPTDHGRSGILHRATPGTRLGYHGPAPSFPAGTQPEPPASVEPARCEHGQTKPHDFWPHDRSPRGRIVKPEWCTGPVAPQPQPATCIHGQTRRHTYGVEGALGTGVIGTGVCMGPAPEQSR